jgi:RNA polymerase sigma-70 factor (ECF subfamily)
MTLNHEQVARCLLAARARLSAVAWLVVRDAQAAEDIFQITSVRAMAQDIAFENEAQLLSWAHVTARHAAIDWLRRHRSQWAPLDADVLDLLEAQATSRPVGARIDALQDCLEAMPKHLHQMLELRYFEGRSCEEVARAIGVKLPTVYQRLSRLHRALKECIERRMAGGPALLGPNAEVS